MPGQDIDLVGRDSPGIFYTVEGIIGNRNVVESRKKRSKAFGFSKSVRKSIFDKIQKKNETPATILKPFDDKAEWRAKGATIGKASRQIDFSKASFVNEAD